MSPAGAVDRIGPRFFGVDLSIDGGTVWPEFSPGVVRVALVWAGIETSPGKFQWASLDYKVEMAEANGARPMLVLQNTPEFHATGPSIPSAVSPPALRAYQRFVRALVKRYGDRVDYQVWNEPSVPIFFNGTPKQMARMTKVVWRATRDLSTSAVVAPSFPLRIEMNRAWFTEYWRQRVNGRPVHRFVDVSNISAYPLPAGRPERALAITRWAQRVVDRAGFAGPMWISEVNYGANGLAPTRKIRPRLQAAYVVRTYALTAAEPDVDRVYWWRWEPHQTVNTTLQDGKGNLTRAGRAYGVVRGWLLGAKPKGCSASPQGIYTCRFRLRDGVRRYVYWKPAGRTRSVTAPTGALSRTSTGGVTKAIVAGAKVRVTKSPTMVEVQRSR
ncbi:putative glycoside hydrolase [metagenome]|uniref:Putative glycoside hydrolase n=1 Tax=metagenome TaxID=256318 RepID=A0A2P2C6L7_9ZZZZ